MKTYYPTLNRKYYQVFYDRNIRLWTVLEIDADGYQISDADYYQNKRELLNDYKFNL